MPLSASRAAANRTEFWVRQVRAVQHGQRGKTAPLRDMKAIGGDTEGGVLVKSSPTSALKVSETQFLFEFLVIAFDDPAMFGQCDKLFEPNRCGYRSEPVFGRLGFGSRPFYEHPSFGSRLGTPHIAMRWPDPHGGKTGS